MTKRAFLAVFVFLLTALPMRADFNSLVRAVSARGLHRIWVPGLGLARFAVWIAHPAGVHDFQLATFEGKARFGREDLAAMVRANADSGYRPVVQAHDRRGETTIIWARPAGRDGVELMLLTHEPGDNTTVLRAVVDMEVFARQMNDPRHARDMASR
jgi:hypothetical protein